MSDFKEAFTKGLEAADAADAAKAEILRVIDVFGREVKDASGGVLVVDFGFNYMPVGDQTIYDKVRGVLPKTQRYESLVARVVDTASPEEELCKISYSSHSYPVRLDWAEVVEICHDVESLEAALRKLLQDPRIGKKFQKLLAQYKTRSGTPSVDD